MLGGINRVRFVDFKGAKRQQPNMADKTKSIYLNRFKFMLTGAAFAMLAITVAADYSPAHADLRVCNKTESLMGVAVGYRDKEGWITEGWWRIPANICTSVIEGDLSSRYFYLHAENADTGGKWRGPVFMCTSNKEFKIRGLKDCFARGFERTGFFEVDTGQQKSWQVRLTDANKSKKEKDKK